MIPSARAFALAVLLAGTIAVSQASRAADAVASASARPVVAMIVFPDEGERFSPIAQAVRAQLSDLEVEPVTVNAVATSRELGSRLEVAKRVTADVGATAVFWCDLSDPARGFLYLADATVERLLIRTLAGEEDGGRAEAVAIIVRTSVVELMRGGTIGVGVETISRGAMQGGTGPIAASTEQEPSPARFDRLFAWASYALHMHGRHHLAVHGANLAVGFRPRERFALLIEYTVLQRIERETEHIAVRLRRHPIGAGARVGLFEGAISLHADLLVVMDYVTFERHELEPGLSPKSDLDDFSLGVELALALEVPIGSRFAAFLSAGAQVSLLSHYYVVDGQNGRQVVLDSWPIQPRLLAGLVVNIL